MKSLPLKLGIGIAIVFGLVGFAVWGMINAGRHQANGQPGYSSESEPDRNGEPVREQRVFTAEKKRTANIRTKSTSQPSRVEHLYSKLYSSNKDERLAGLLALISLGDVGKKALVDFCGSVAEAEFIFKIWTKPNPLTSSMNLCFAVQKDYLHASQFLIDNGSKIESDFMFLESPLYNAASSGHLRMVKLLLDHGADINGHGKMKMPPIIPATENGHIHIVRYLLEAGADVNACYNKMPRMNGVTALDKAKTDELKELLRSYDAKTYMELKAEEENK